MSEVVGECSLCGATITRLGPTSTMVVHAKGCTRTGKPFGDHLDTKCVIEQSKARDAAQSERQERLLRNPSPFRSDIGK